jgi:RNA polymerase sigma-70 factor (ECF subfamily)
MLSIVAKRRVNGGSLGVSRRAEVGRFEELIRDLLQPAYRLALTILRDEGLAEDAVQEASVKAWTKIGSLRDEGSARSWFLAIVANQCRSSFRKPRWGLSLLGDSRAGLARGADEVASQRLDVSRALRALSVDDRVAIYLYYYMDLPVPEGARVARVSESAFRSRLARATKRMRPHLTLEEPADG